MCEERERRRNGGGGGRVSIDLLLVVRREVMGLVEYSIMYSVKGRLIYASKRRRLL